MSFFASSLSLIGKTISFPGLDIQIGKKCSLCPGWWLSYCCFLLAILREKKISFPEILFFFFSWHLEILRSRVTLHFLQRICRGWTVKLCSSSQITTGSAETHCTARVDRRGQVPQPPSICVMLFWLFTCCVFKHRITQKHCS